MHPLSGHTIVFMPGLDGTGITFEPLGRLLPEDVTVRIIRYPVDRLLDFEETVQCARDQLPADLVDAIVIAESFSGPVAIALVASGQVRVKCLILCATFARAPRPVVLHILMYLPLRLFLKLPFPRFLYRLVVEGGDDSVDLFLSFWRRVKPLVSAEVLVHRLEVIRRMDLRALLPRLAVPCLYIQATADRSVPARNVTDFTGAVPDLRVVRIRGPHFILQAQPYASLAAIQSFVSSLADRSAPRVGETG